MENGNEDASSPPSPPTPPSPLPVSFGPENLKYMFSSSPSASPPFSPICSSNTSSENQPLLRRKLSAPARLPSPFSLDCRDPSLLSDDQNSSCLKDLFLWLLQRCCGCLLQLKQHQSI